MPICATTKLGPLLIAGERLLPARLDNAEARYADFRGADLRRMRMTGSDLSYANLGDAGYARHRHDQGANCSAPSCPMQFAEAASA